ncbi:MAG: DUF1493 family protein [Pirellulales bacterium]|nr:DUF1493 family protein [Pirellulales bacterium]
MSTEDAVVVEVLALLREHVGKRPPITMDTTLFGDLGIYGDDAAKLLKALQERFGIDLSQLCFESHFLPEAYSLEEFVVLPFTAIRRFYRRYLSRATPEEGEGLIPVTVACLVESIRKGEWPAAWSR